MAQELRTSYKDRLLDMVFCDVASFYVVCEEYHRVWVDMMTEWHREQVVFSKLFKQEEPICIRWHAAVNARLEEPLLCKAMGTTGYTTTFHVSCRLLTFTTARVRQVGQGSKAWHRRVRRR